MAAATGKVLFQPGVRCQATPPLFRGTPVTSRLNRVIHKRTRQQAKVLALFRGAGVGARREHVRSEPNGSWPETHVLSLRIRRGGLRIQVAF